MSYIKCLALCLFLSKYSLMRMTIVFINVLLLSVVKSWLERWTWLLAGILNQKPQILGMRTFFHNAKTYPKGRSK